MDIQLTQRNGSLPDLVTLLRQQYATKLDVVIPAAGIRSDAGIWSIDGTGLAVLGPDDVTTTPGTFAPTDTCDAGVADKLDIPVGYLRRLREEHLGLYDANVNGWLEQQPGRRLLIRTLRGREGDGIARAVLSERYRFVDNLDVLLAVLDGIRSAGADVEVRRCDLTERRMYVQIGSQSVAAQADVLLADYVSPFTGARGADNPLGVRRVRAVELGDRAWVVLDHAAADRPGLRQRLHDHERCDAGVHLGGRLDAGVVQWSAGTQQAAIELITRQAADAASACLTGDYLRRSLADIEQRAGVPVRDVPATLKYVAAQCRFTDEQQATILDHFIGGADCTAGGVLQAVTSAAQAQDDADAAYELERLGLRAMTLAAAHQN
jgi:hypothetical protein